jgi:hypothetical protein
VDNLKDKIDLEKIEHVHENFNKYARKFKVIKMSETVSEEIDKEKISEKDLILDSPLSIQLNKILKSKELLKAIERITSNFDEQN